MLDWEGCFNVRDLGGLPTLDGRATRFGALVRADDLCRLTEVGSAAARAHGVSAVVDLRNADEMPEGSPLIRRLSSGAVLDQVGTHPFCAVDGVAYHQLRLRDGPDVRIAATSQIEIYQHILRHGAGPFARVARAVATAPPGAVVVHCVIGKDRTGLAVAVLLSAVGVTDDAVAADYARSDECLRPMRAFRVALGRSRTTDPPDALYSPPETMLALLAELRETYGGAAGYLRAGGLTDDELARLGRRLVG